MGITQQIFLRLTYYPVFWITILQMLSLLNPVLPEIIYRVDPLALLAATLRTYQRGGCDSEQLSLSCPRGTSISIELAQYGSAEDVTENNLCPANIKTEKPTAEDTVVHSKTEIEVKPSESCLWPNALQYSLLQTIVEACQKKSHCKFTSTPKSVAGDPCPGITKFVEIAYKCRPYEFRSKVACENDVIQLMCNPYSRIAIYSASFGRTEYESVQCAQPHGVKEETCVASYATETVMQICHGRRRCILSADTSTFGRPCSQNSKMYLKVVYTCIPRKVLKDRYDTLPEPDEPQQAEIDLDQDDLYDEDQFYKESEAIPPAPKLQGGLTNSIHPYPGYPGFDSSSSVRPPILIRNDGSQEEKKIISTNFPITEYKNNKTNIKPMRNFVQSDDGKLNKNFLIKKLKTLKNITKINNGTISSDDCVENIEVIGFISEWIRAYIFIANNQERFYLYVIISVAAAVLICLTLVISRLLIQRRRTKIKKQNKKFQPSTADESTIPNGFNDDISEIDGEIDLTTPLPILPSTSRNENYITYTPAPNSYGNNLAPTNVSHASTTMLVPSTGLMATIGGRQMTPPPTMIGPSNVLMGPPTSGTVGSLMPISAVSHHTMAPSFLSGTVMVGHHHGTLRRPFVPVSGILMSPSPSPLNSLPQTNVCYSSTIPRTLSKGIIENSSYYQG